VPGTLWQAFVRFVTVSVVRGRGTFTRSAPTRLGLVALGFCVCLAWTSAGVAQTYQEDAVKAAFLHRFAAYVQWPESAEPGPFIIAVEGADDIADQLEQLLPGLTIQSRKAEVRRARVARDLEGVSILYIGPGRRPQAQALMRIARTRPILLVTDTEDGLASGAIINFIRVERTIRFEVSLTAAEQTGLKINSGLLSVAARVEGRPQAGIGCLDRGSGAVRASCLRLFAMNDPGNTGPIAGATLP
jgi:hypothetical protein